MDQKELNEEWIINVVKEKRNVILKHRKLEKIWKDGFTVHKANERLIREVNRIWDQQKRKIGTVYEVKVLLENNCNWAKSDELLHPSRLVNEDTAIVELEVATTNVSISEKNSGTGNGRKSVELLHRSRLVNEDAAVGELEFATANMSISDKHSETGKGDQDASRNEMRTFSAADIAILIGERPFDHFTIRRLELYISHQLSTNAYDFEANKVLLKNYTVNNEILNPKIVAQILILSVMQLPKTDYLALSYLVPARAAAMPEMQSISICVDMLESGQFCKFWTEFSKPEVGNTFSVSPYFTDAIRTYILQAVRNVFKNIPLHNFGSMMGLSSLKLADFMSSNSFIGQVTT